MYAYFEDHKAYWNPKTKSYGAAQTANLLPLFLDITPAELLPAATQAYVASVVKNKYLTNSGIIGAAYMLQTLGKVGHGDIALKIALATSEPSWCSTVATSSVLFPISLFACMVVVHRGFMVQKGPGTIWESWTDSTNSHNHPALSADIGVFLYTLAGVQPSTWGKHGTDRVITFSLDPKTSYLVNAASVYVGSTGGRAAFSWSFHQHDHHQHHPGDHNRSLLDDHRTAATTAAAFEVNATIPHGEQAAVELLIPDPTRLLSGQRSHCHVLRRAGTAIWSDCDDSQAVGLIVANDDDIEASLLMRQHGVFGVEVATTTATAGDGSNKAIVLVGSGEHRLTLELELL